MDMHSYLKEFDGDFCGLFGYKKYNSNYL
jgi:hypothetical protein